MKARYTRIWLVQIIDEEGDEIGCEYVAGCKAQAQAAAKAMKENIKEYRRSEKRRAKNKNI